MSCADVFSAAEWKSVYVVVRKEQPPADPPRLQEMVSLIGRLGGHLGQTNDGPPDRRPCGSACKGWRT
jgi:hypothetical protein